MPTCIEHSAVYLAPQLLHGIGSGRVGVGAIWHSRAEGKAEPHAGFSNTGDKGRLSVTDDRYDVGKFMPTCFDRNGAEGIGDFGATLYRLKAQKISFVAASQQEELVTGLKIFMVGVDEVHVN